MNTVGAVIPEENTPSGTKDIFLPNQTEDIDAIAIDIGGTLSKVTYFSRKKFGTGGRLHFQKFPTDSIEEFINFIHDIVQDGLSKKKIVIKATGGGAHKYFNQFKEALGMELQREDEMKCLIHGLNFLLQKVPQEVFATTETQQIIYQDILTKEKTFPYMLVNIGSGVSILKVTGEDTYERVSGTSLGGGTLWGLLSLLTDCKDFDEMLKLSTNGDNRNVDMLVGDIYGSDYSSVGLKATTIASSFGKVFKKDFDKKSVRKEDIARSALFMISNNIGQIAYLNAVHHNLNRIYFGGSFIRGHLDTMRTISFAINFWSQGTMKALFLRHDGYLGCLGALTMYAKSVSTESVVPAQPEHIGVLDRSPSNIRIFPLNGESESVNLDNPETRESWISTSIEVSTQNQTNP